MPLQDLLGKPKGSVVAGNPVAHIQKQRDLLSRLHKLIPDVTQAVFDLGKGSPDRIDDWLKTILETDKERIDQSREALDKLGNCFGAAIERADKVLESRKLPDAAGQTAKPLKSGSTQVPREQPAKRIIIRRYRRSRLK